MVVPLDAGMQTRANALAATALAIIRAHLGLPRGTLLEAWSQVALAPGEVRLARGLWKLALDACHFDEGGSVRLGQLRRDIFLRAARGGAPGPGLDRAQILAEAAAGPPCRGIRGRAGSICRLAVSSPLAGGALARAGGPGCKLPARSTAGRAPARRAGAGVSLLRRSGRVSRSLSPAEFHRLLYISPRLERGGYAVDIDGPFSLFEHTTKYGLRLALALPALMACARWDLAAELRWGKERRPLRYHISGEKVDLPEASSPIGEATGLLTDLRNLASPWQIGPAQDILDVPGIGVCVPDLEFVDRETGQRVFFELLGFWSRAAVWKRVEMVERGLGEPIVFAVSKHLRVSEEVLPDEATAALYVYARAPNATMVLDHVARLAARARR